MACPNNSVPVPGIDASPDASAEGTVWEGGSSVPEQASGDVTGAQPEAENAKPS